MNLFGKDKFPCSLLVHFFVFWRRIDSLVVGLDSFFIVLKFSFESGFGGEDG